MVSVSEAPAAPASRTVKMLRLTLPKAPGRVRLGTLNNLRWLAVVGQAVALLIVQLALDFEFPLLLATAPIAASAVLNIILALAYPASKRLSAAGGSRRSSSG